MAKLESNLKNMLLSLTCITLVAAAALAGVFMLTKPIIDQKQKEKTQQAIMAVLPQMEGLEIAAPDTIAEKHIILHKAYVKGEWVGTAVEVNTANNTNKPFGDAFSAMVGFDSDGNIVNYQILKHSETPGLGAKMGVWFAEGGKGSIIGKSPKAGNWAVTKDGGSIDAITAATITSRAFLEMVQEAYNSIADQPVDACSAASNQSNKKED